MILIVGMSSLKIFLAIRHLNFRFVTNVTHVVMINDYQLQVLSTIDKTLSENQECVYIVDISNKVYYRA